MPARLILVVLLFFLGVGVHVCKGQTDLRLLHEKLSHAKDTLRIESLLDIAWYFMHNKTDSALSYAHEAKEGAQLLNHKILESKAENAIGVAYIMSGDYVQGISHNLRSLELAQSVNFVKGYPSLLHNIGYDYYTLGESEQALDFLNQALMWSIRLDDTVMQAASYNSIGEVYVLIHEYNKAILNIQLAFALYQRTNNSSDLALCYSNLGRAYHGNREYQKSIGAFQKSLTLRSAEDEYGRAACYLGLIENHISMKRYSHAITYCEMVESICGANNFLPELSTAAQLRSTIYSETGRFKKALESYIRYKHLEDSIMNSRKASEIKRLQVQFDSKQKEAQVELLSKEAKYERTRLYSTLATAVLVVVILALLVGQFWRRHSILKREHKVEQQRNQIEQQRMILENQRLQHQEEAAKLERTQLTCDLEQRQRELLTSAMHLQQQKDMLGALLCDIRQIQRLETKDIPKELSRLQKDIRLKINQSDDWDQIRMHFDHIHPGFFLRLKNLDCALTNSDIRLCAYIKMNLSNKEISQILRINPSSVQVSKFRLRRKLGLDEREELSKYILVL